MFHPIKQTDMEALAAYQHQLWKHPKLRYLFFELTVKLTFPSGCVSFSFSPLDILLCLSLTIYVHFWTTK